MFLKSKLVLQITLSKIINKPGSTINTANILNIAPLASKLHIVLITLISEYIATPIVAKNIPKALVIIELEEDAKASLTASFLSSLLSLSFLYFEVNKIAQSTDEPN